MSILEILVDGIPSRSFYDWNSRTEKLIACIVMDEKRQNEKTIFAQKHSPSALREWIRSSRDAIMFDEPPEFLKIENSVAEAIEDFYETSEIEKIERYGDAILEYRKSHDFRFAFRGTDIPATIVGKSQGKYAISSLNSEKSLFYFSDSDIRYFLYSF